MRSCVFVFFVVRESLGPCCAGKSGLGCMAYRSLRDFVARLEADGELVRVREPVKTELEITEICTRLLASGGPAVLFEKPVMADGSISPIPCLANLFGTVKRVAMGVTLQGKGRTSAS